MNDPVASAKAELDAAEIGLSVSRQAILIRLSWACASRSSAAMDGSVDASSAMQSSHAG